MPRPPEPTCKQMNMAVVLACWGCHTKYEELGDFSNRSGLLIVLEAGKSKIKVLADSVCGEGFLFGLQMATFLSVSSHRVGLGGSWGEKDSSSFSYKTIILSD